MIDLHILSPNDTEYSQYHVQLYVKWAILYLLLDMSGPMRGKSLVLRGETLVLKQFTQHIGCHHKALLYISIVCIHSKGKSLLVDSSAIKRE